MQEQKIRFLRREMRQFESSWYDDSKVERSKFRLTRLQYFSEVDVDTAQVPGTTDQVDLNVMLLKEILESNGRCGCKFCRGINGII
jgi:outer membrane protein assembly factor BamA